METMKAAICTKYGAPEFLKIQEINKPIPKNDEVCVKVHAAGVTASDIFIRGLNISLPMRILMRVILGLGKPRNGVVGITFAGVIESVGKNVERFKPGDKIYGNTGMKMGTYAEYLCIKEKDTSLAAIGLMPSNITYEQATALVYGGMLAFRNLEKYHIHKGDKVLIYGASGTSGTIAIQIVKHIGAEVTAVCSTSNIEMVKSLGADHVIDYTKQDSIPEDMKFNLILDSVGKNKTSKLKIACRNSLLPKGKYISIDDGLPKLDTELITKLTEYAQAGIIIPVIDKTYPLDEIVEAHRYVEKGHKKGGVAISNF